MSEGIKYTIINSTRFGEIKVDTSILLDFVVPIIGYEKFKKFAIVDNNPNSPFKWLQSVADPELAFPITLTDYFDIEYDIEIPEEDIKLLEAENADDIMALNIVSIPQGNPQASTMNLRAPIIVNTQNHKAAQIILKDNKYDIRYPLF
ncbi:flagellar assembly protein FliW [bacterium]|nr:flagellar assembly protein FliW [bacterium]